MNSKAAFFDRDGTLIRDTGYLCETHDIEWLPGAFEALLELKKRDFLLFIVTNQSGIGRGLFTESQYQEVTSELIRQAKNRQIEFAGIYHCPHRPEDNCECRKPRPGLFLKAIQEHALNPKESFAIGDRSRDLEAAQQAGVSKVFSVAKDSGLSSFIEQLDG